jgi:hypothetical protein
VFEEVLNLEISNQLSASLLQDLDSSGHAPGAVPIELKLRQVDG